MLLNHATLECNAAGPSTLRFQDREDPTAATVDLDLSAEGCPLASHAIRPRLVGKQSGLTPWSGIASEFREYDGLRVATHLEVICHLAEGPFTYFRGELTSFKAVKVMYDCGVIIDSSPAPLQTRHLSAIRLT